MSEENLHTNHYLSFWGKQTRDGCIRHPLIFHMMDTTNCVFLIWDTVLQSQIRCKFSECVGLNDCDTKRIIAFWAGLHDLGKVDDGFQKLKIQREPHNLLTTVAFNSLFPDNKFYRRLAQVLGGHHGSFPLTQTLYRLVPPSDIFKKRSRQIKDVLAEIYDIQDDYHQLLKDKELDNATAMKLAGLVSVADWIASNDQFFPYINQITSISEYNKQSQKQAQEALTKVLHWTHWKPADTSADFKMLFPELSGRNRPRPLQQTTITLCSKLKSPSLVIIEAPTGEGKSEAAMLLADHFSSALKQKGMYFALPTQATSNQMFRRVMKFLKRRYSSDEFPIMLQHGHASLNEEFQQIKDNVDIFHNPNSDDDENKKGSGPIVASWFTYRKRGLLAPFGVGTIDQVLLAVLQTKHFFVRLYGLAGKTIIIDEVHAYDTYMITLLERLLEWLAAMDCCVIMLSATLPRQRCLKLIEAFKKGRTQSNNPALNENLEKYPRISWVCDDFSGSATFETSDQNHKQYKIRWVEGRFSEYGNEFVLGEELKEKLKDGGCAAVICNTVNRCQKIYQILKQYFPQEELYIFHARYLFKDRQQREQQILEWFSKDRSHRPHRMVLVATQVIEQSLDIDFDLMITDMAPIDLILQRAGRLHRHHKDDQGIVITRPAQLQEPQLWICQPEEIKDDIPIFDGGTEALYKETKHILFRSWLSLKDRDVIVIPDQTEELIESAYGENRCIEELTDLQKMYWWETFQKMSDKWNSLCLKAKTNAILPPDYEDDILEDYNRLLKEDASDIHEIRQALTRPMEIPSVSVIILFGNREQGFFDIEKHKPVDFNLINNKATIQLLYNSTTLNDYKIAPWLCQNGWIPNQWKDSSLLRNYRVIILSDQEGIEVQGRLINIDPESGILITKKGISNEQI